MTEEAHRARWRRGAAQAPRTLGRRLREREARERTILRAASRLFLAKGIAAATMNDIAKACDLAKGPFTCTSGGKKRSHSPSCSRQPRICWRRSVVRSTVADRSPSSSSVSPSPTTDSSWPSLLLSLHVRHPSRELLRPGSRRTSGTVAGRGRSALRLLAGLIEQGVAEGALVVADPWATAVGLWSAITGIIVIPSQEVRRPLLGEVDLERLVLEAVRSLLRGIGSGRPMSRRKRGLI